MVYQIVESGWFGTAQKSDRKHDVAIDPSEKLCTSIHELVDSTLDNRIHGFSFAPKDYKHNISFELTDDRKFELLFREGDAQFGLEKQLAEFVKFILFLGSYNFYEKIRLDVKSNVISEDDGVAALLSNDFVIFVAARKFYQAHWVPWCRENGVVPNIALWGGAEKTFEEFLISEPGKIRAKLWTDRLRAP